MSPMGLVGIIAPIVIVLALFAWILVVIRADRDPVLNRHPKQKLKRGRVSGGAIRGDPGQGILTGEAPRLDKETRNGPLDL
jgi:hypothetical protein